MTMVLRQGTAVDVLIGPFLNNTDGFTSESGESPAVKLSKNGQTLNAKNDATVPTHDADGYYNCELDATDLNTVGTLVLTVAASANALPVRHEFQVIEEAAYDFLYAGSANPNAAVNAEVLDVLTVDTFAEPGQGNPSATASLKDKIGYLFKNWLNPKTATGTTFSLLNNAGTVVDQKATVSNVSGTYSHGKIVTGP